MRQKKISKKVVVSTVEIAEARFIDGEITPTPLPPLTFFGNVSPEKIAREIRKKYGIRQVFVTHSTKTTRYYEMTVEAFTQFAT